MNNRVNGLISIIVPMFNSEKTIERVINSVLNQTYKNFELIIIDDGSTDNSYNICKKYEENNKSIILVNKPNGGVSSARNRGLLIAKGEFISFIDADDYVDNNYLEVLHKILIDNGADFSWCFQYNFYKHLDASIHNIDVNDYNFIDPYLNIAVVWGHLFRYNIIYNIIFDEKYKYGEDNLFRAAVLHQSKKCTFIKMSLYHYTPAPNSAMSKKFNVDIHNSIYSRQEIIQMFSDKPSVQKSLIVRFYYVIYLTLFMYYKDETFSSYYKMYLSLYRKKFRYVLKGAFGLKQKIIRFCVLFFPKLFLRILNNRYKKNISKDNR